jgi:hypothetical protein
MIDGTAMVSDSEAPWPERTWLHDGLGKRLHRNSPRAPVINTNDGSFGFNGSANTDTY